MARYIAQNRLGEDEKRYDFMYLVMQKKIERQMNSFDSLQAKINNLFGFTAIIVGGYLTLTFDNKIKFGGNPIVVFLNLISLLGLILVMIFLLISVKTRIFLDPPDTETIYSEVAFSKNLGDLKNQVIADFKASYIKTTDKLNNIALWFDLSLITLFISILVIIISSFVQTQCIK